MAPTGAMVKQSSVIAWRLIHRLTVVSPIGTKTTAPRMMTTLTGNEALPVLARHVQMLMEMQPLVQPLPLTVVTSQCSIASSVARVVGGQTTAETTAWYRDPQVSSAIRLPAIASHERHASLQVTRETVATARRDDGDSVACDAHGTLTCVPFPWPSVMTFPSDSDAVECVSLGEQPLWLDEHYGFATGKPSTGYVAVVRADCDDHRCLPLSLRRPALSPLR